MFYIKWYKYFILNETMNILTDPKENCNVSRPPFNCENIPQEMKTYPQWCWAKITENKIPRIIGTDSNAKANGTNCENTWRKFEVYENIVKNDPSKAESYFAGFVLSNKDPYVIIDLDDKDTTTDSERSNFRDIINYFGSYTEISSGGKGYHIILKCHDLPEKLAHNRKGHYEVYKDGRFMILTGNIYNNFKNIAVVKYEKICEFISKYCVNNENKSIFTQKSLVENKTKLKNTQKNTKHNTKLKNTLQNTKNDISLTDKQILDIAIKKTLNTTNACLFGNSPYSNITDQSSADFALFCVLIEAGAISQAQVANIYHSLPIGSRDKAYRADYIERTYKNALEAVKYKPTNYTNYQKHTNDDYQNKPQIDLPDLEVFDFENENCNFTEPFPIEVLPQEVQNYINSLAGDTPPEIVALTALSAFATTYQGIYNLKSYKNSKFGVLPTNLSSFILAPSSFGKSTTIDIFCKPLKELSDVYEQEREKIFKQIQVLEKSLAKCVDNKEKRRIKSDIKELTDSLPIQNITTIHNGKSTAEGMRELVETNKNLFIYNPEAGNLFAFGGKRDAINFLVEYTNRHDGIAPEHRTKTQGVNKNTNLRASQVYMLQPSTFNDFGGDFLKLIIAQGTLSRTLFTCVYSYTKKPLDPTILPTEITVEEPCFKRFYSVVKNLFENNQICVSRVTKDLEIDDLVMFEDSCYAFYVEKYNEINSNFEDKNAQENSIYGKLLENAQRLAVCFHFMDLIFNDLDQTTLTPNLPLSDYANKPISLDCFKRAYKFAEYCAKSQAHYANIGKSYEEDNENILLATRCIQTLFRAKFKNEMQITSSLLANLTKTRSFKCKKADVDNIIPLLQKLGILLANDDASVKSRGYVYSINPRLFRDFNTFEEYKKKMIKK